MSERQQMIEMGFEERRVDWALHATNNKGLQAAMDHLVENSERPIPEFDASAPASSTLDNEDQAALDEMYAKQGQEGQDNMLSGIGEAKSIKCTDCGKILKSAAFASFHAEKSGHTNFEESTEEIKPLTEEEKKQRLEEMRAKLAEKRAKQSKEDAQANRENEKIRRKAGQEMGEVREDMKRKEALREAEKRKKEAKADAEAKKRVREQIEADKRERAEKAAREKAIREGRVQEATPDTRPSAAALAAATAAPKSSSNESRLRVRAPGGTWSGTLSAESTLNDVEKSILADGKAQSPLNFSTTFPRKVLSGEEKAKTLRELGFVPNAALEANHS